MKRIATNLTNALDAIKEGLYVLDEELNTLYVNKAYEKITGLSYELLKNKTAYDIVREGLTSNSVSILVAEKRCPISMIQQFPNGKTALITGTPVFNNNDELTNIIVTVSDVTEKNNLYETLIREKIFMETEEEDLKKIADSLIVYKSAMMEKIVSFAIRLAKTDSPILITGETGVGKEVVARLIHQTSLRSEKPFVVINCAAIPPNLAESELFGYVDGAFTGAKKGGYAGIFERAHTGTVFLDEIGELSLDLQSKLLRTLQEYTVTRIGDNKIRKVDFRVIAATNRNLLEMAEQEKFRSDLYYRLNVINVNIPPLRARTEDIPPLIEMKINKLNTKYQSEKTIEKNALHLLLRYRWPGNVRELHNTIERIYLCAELNTITAEDVILYGNIHPALSVDSAPDVPASIHSDPPAASAADTPISLKSQLAEYEKKLIFETLKDAKSMKEAAKMLDIDPSTLTRKCQQYQITSKI